MKKHGNRILSLVLIFLVILGGVIFPTKANADESVVGDKTVRVGFYVIDGYQYYNDSGEEAGFGVEYLNLISNFTDWKYEYVEVDSYTSALNKLDKGDIDLVAPIPMNSEWYDKYMYSDYEICTGRYVLVCNKGDKRFAYEDVDSLKGVRVGVPNGYPIT